MSSKAFEAGWEELLKAAECPQCGAVGGEPCAGKGGDGPANRCKMRRRQMESGDSKVRSWRDPTLTDRNNNEDGS